jgi:AraC-like DNA-binding protein
MQPEWPIVSAKVFEGFEAFLKQLGVDLAPLLKPAGIDPVIFAGLNTDLPLQHVSALFELAAQAAGDPCLGLHWAEAFAPGSTGVFGYSILNAATLREAMQAAARYLGLVVHPARVSFVETAEGGALQWHLPSLTATSTTQYVAFSVAATALRLRAVAGPGWVPCAVELTHRELPCSDTLRRIFGSRIAFNAPINSIQADPTSLDLKTTHADRRLFNLIEQLGEHMLAQRATPHDIVALCQKAIVDGLNQSDVTLERAAESLQMAPRTLQSKLAQSGTTFDALLQETRKELAVGYLRESDLSLTDIAILLGFSELSAFSRATQRWFGVPPSTYRQQLRNPDLKTAQS